MLRLKLLFRPSCHASGSEQIFSLPLSATFHPLTCHLAGVVLFGSATSRGQAPRHSFPTNSITELIMISSLSNGTSSALDSFSCCVLCCLVGWSAPLHAFQTFNCCFSWSVNVDLGHRPPRTSTSKRGTEQKEAQGHRAKRGSKTKGKCSNHV